MKPRGTTRESFIAERLKGETHTAGTFLHSNNRYCPPGPFFPFIFPDKCNARGNLLLCFFLNGNFCDAEQKINRPRNFIVPVLLHTNLLFAAHCKQSM